MSEKNAIRNNDWPDPAAAAISVAQERLQGSAYGALRSVRCERHADHVVLRGRVPSYYFKQLAQEVVRKTEGVSRIVNNVEVDK